MNFPEKSAPGQYDVVCWVEGSRFLWRFKTERDAMRFYHSAERGVRIKNHGEMES